MRALDRGIER
jgi:hypothetical protein